MRNATEWFEVYGQSHQNPVNKAIHWVCIPVIMLSTLGLFQAIPLPMAPLPMVHVGMSVGLFFAAWLVQFVGHKIDGEKPSCFQDLQFLLIGPAWLMQFVFTRIGVPVETWSSTTAAAA